MCECDLLVGQWLIAFVGIPSRGSGTGGAPSLLGDFHFEMNGNRIPIHFGDNVIAVVEIT